LVTGLIGTILTTLAVFFFVLVESMGTAVNDSFDETCDPITGPSDPAVPFECR
jgi:4-hydroxybenzoate polyprenyltransferase